MNAAESAPVEIPAWQQEIMAKCVHPTGSIVPFPPEALGQSLAARFAAQAALHPRRLALQTRTLELTYDGLNRAANRVAWAVLGVRGGRPGPIAVLADNDAPAFVASLGVLKAGQIVVFLDPTLPRARLAEILDISGAGPILSTARHAALAGELAGRSRDILDLDALPPSAKETDPGVVVAPDDLAWILYTSGSTGTPKGVVHDQQSLMHDIRVNSTWMRLCPEDRLAKCSQSLGVIRAIRETFCAWLNGAALVVFDRMEEGLDRLPEWLSREKITILDIVASLFRRVGEGFRGRDATPHLRVVYLGGDPPGPGDVELYKTHCSARCILMNGLGTSETGTIRVRFGDKDTPTPPGTVPAGYAVEGREILITDDTGREVPAGSVGEITVRSRYLSRGYWRRPDLTEQAFATDPADEAMRIFRTGDAGLLARDGDLRHLGRRDFQVKVRGFRVEMAEVEGAVAAVNGVKEAVVVRREDRAGEPRLVAYVVATGDPAPTVSELRRELSERLPEYMVPSTFVVMPALPLTQSGKVDRQALPAPGRGRPALGYPAGAPRTPLEATVAGIWADLLDLDEVGVHDPFLDLGGHSLLASQIVGRMLETLAVDVPVRALLEASTVAEMALVVAQQLVGQLDLAEAMRLLSEVEGPPPPS